MNENQVIVSRFLVILNELCSCLLISLLSLLHDNPWSLENNQSTRHREENLKFYLLLVCWLSHSLFLDWMTGDDKRMKMRKWIELNWIEWDQLYMLLEIRRKKIQRPRVNFTWDHFHHVNKIIFHQLNFSFLIPWLIR